MNETELHVYRFEVDWFVAANAEDAQADFRAHCLGLQYDESDIRGDCSQLDDALLLGIFHDERGCISDSGDLIQKTCGEWAREKGRGFLCTSEL